MRNRDDEDLRGLFKDLREEDRKRIPEFGILMARARREAVESGLRLHDAGKYTFRISRKLAWRGSLLAAAAAAALLLIQVPHTSDSEFVQVVQRFSADPASGAWKSPTDGLLDLPGNTILSTVPSIGTSQWLLDPGPNPRRNEL